MAPLIKYVIIAIGLILLGFVIRFLFRAIGMVLFVSQLEEEEEKEEGEKSRESTKSYISYIY